MRSLKVLFLIGLVLVGGTSSVLAMGDAGFVHDTTSGKRAADFTLTTVKNEKFNFTQYRAGKKAIIFFWATWCPHCREALKEINAMRAEIAANGIVLVFVSVGESREAVANYLADHQYDFDVALDEKQSLDEAYQIVGVPTLVFVDEKGMIKSVDHGFSNSYQEQFK